MKAFVIILGVLVGTTTILGTIASEQRLKNFNSLTVLRSPENNLQTDDYKTFRKEQERKIAENDKKIAELKQKKDQVKKERVANYENKIIELENKNNELRKRIMVNYKDEGKEKWESFKKEFKHDMDELGKSLKDLFKDNVK